LIGGDEDGGGVGAAWIYTRSGFGSPFAKQTKLLASDEVGPSGSFGASVALSSDGTTAAIGGNGDNSNAGAAWLFTRPAPTSSAWSQQGLKFSGGSEEIAEGEFGNSVALASDGETLLVGARQDFGGRGAVWAFAPSDPVCSSVSASPDWMPSPTT
jgi:hypothetical protein